MSTAGSRDVRYAPELFWQIRERELGRKLAALKTAIEDCEQARRVLYEISETAKLNEPQWDTAQSSAMSCLRRARATKTTVRRMIASLRDTIRIRPHLAEAVTPKTTDMLDTATRLCEYLDVHGY